MQGAPSVSASSDYPTDGVVDDEDDDGSDDRHQQAVEVEPGDAGLPEGVEEPAADDRADDAEDDVEDEPLAGLVDDLAGDEAGDEAEYDPGDEGHGTLLGRWIEDIYSTSGKCIIDAQPFQPSSARLLLLFPCRRELRRRELLHAGGVEPLDRAAGDEVADEAVDARPGAAAAVAAVWQDEVQAVGQPARHPRPELGRGHRIASRLPNSLHLV